MNNTNTNNSSELNNQNIIKLSDRMYLSKKELSQYTGWKASKINRLMREGAFSYYEDGNILYKRTDIDEYLNSLKILGKDEISKQIKG